jgi:thiol-disulfide isomerase/thioredoxin
MTGLKNQTGAWMAVFICVCLIAAMMILSAVQKPTKTNPLLNIKNEPSKQQVAPEKTAAETVGKKSRYSLAEIISTARTWTPAYQQWRGKEAPDFLLTDINGKSHKLSDYRGKNVLILFWATWCRPCIIEIPHLVALRNVMGQDKLAMLAISNEPEALLKAFTVKTNINYTVLSVQRPLPQPYSFVKYIPESFFVGPDGKFKLAASGALSLGETKAIINADH